MYHSRWAKEEEIFLLFLLLILEILSRNALSSFVASLVCFMQERVIFDSVKGPKTIVISACDSLLCAMATVCKNS